MKRVTTFILLTIFACSARSQSTFQKSYGGPGPLEDIAYSIEETFDGGYIVAGHTEEFGAQQRDILLIKLDALGDTVWSKMYGGTSDERAFSVVQTMDSGFVVAGRVDLSGNDDVLVIKTNSTGDVIWMKNYGSSNNEQGNDIVENSDSTLVVVGWTDGFGAGGKDAYILALSPIGDTLWTRTYGGIGDDDLESISNSIGGGGYIVAGNSNSWSSNKAYILRLDDNGDTLWTKIFGGTQDHVYSIEENPADSGWIVGGLSYSYGAGGGDMFMAKLEYSGAISWFKTYGTGQDDAAYTARPTSDGGFIAAGYTWQLSPDMFVVKTNNVGDTVWTRVFGSEFGDEIAYDIQLTSDGGYVLCGTYFDVWGTGNEQVYVVKINANGKAIGCQQQTSNAFELSHTPTTDVATTSLMGTGALTATPSISTTLVSPGYVDYGMVLTFDSTAVSCYGDADGAASVVASCGTAPFTYSWSPGGSTNDSISGLSAGTYLVQVTDAGGTIALDSVEVTEPSVLTGGAMMMMETECDSICTGMAEAMANGGNGGYTYAWDNGAGNQTSQNADSLCLGTFFITVTDSKGCTVVDSVEVSSMMGMGGGIGVYIQTEVDAACSTACNAVVVAFNNFGWSPLTYLWDDPAAQTTDTASGLCVGSHVVKVWDSRGCVEYDTVTVNAIGDSMSLSMVGYDITCNLWCNGSASAGIGGNIPGPYVYTWNDPSGQTTQTADSLCAGTYTLTFTDTNGCFSLTDSVTISNSYPSSNLQFMTQDASCVGVCDGQAEVFPSGPFPPNMWLWDDPSGQTTALATGLCGGTYTVVVTDDQGCMQDTGSVVVADVVPVITLTTSNVNVICNGICDGIGAVNASATYPPVSYLWDDPAAQTADSATGLCPGIYTVSVTDSLGCMTVMDSITVGTDAFAPEDICVITVDTTSTKNVIVWGKPVTAGIDSFRIYRDIVGTYTHVGSVPYTDLSYFEDSTAGINPTVTSYRYTISTVDTCGAESVQSAFHKTIHLQVVPGIPPAMQLSWDDYEGFSFTFYRILRDTTGLGYWEKLDSTSFGINSFTDPNPPQTGYLRYIVEVVAPDTCVAGKVKNFNSSKSNTATTTTPPALGLTTSSTDATPGNCDGTATAVPTNGTTPYTYSWNTSPVQTTATATGLCGNTSYTILVTDANGDTISTTVFITESGSSLDVSAASTMADPGICNGTATATPSGGTSPYTYAWNTSPVQSNATATGLCGNTTYTVIITDANGDTASTSVLVSELVSISISTLNQLLSVYPNPNNGSFIMDMNLPGQDKWTLSCVNTLGSEIHFELLGTVNGSLRKTINLSEAGNGVYFINLYNEKVTLRKRIIVY